MPQRGLRPWSLTIAVQKCSWMSGTARSGRVFRKPPVSATFEVIGPRRSRRYWAIALKMRTMPGTRQAGEVRRVGREAEHEVRMILQVLSDARQMVHRGDAVLLQGRRVADAGQHQELRRLERAGAQDHLAPRADLLRLVALPVFDADGALAVEQDARRVRLGLDAEVRPLAHEGMDVAARRAPALAVLLGHLIDAEAFLLGAVEVVD